MATRPRTPEEHIRHITRIRDSHRNWSERKIANIVLNSDEPDKMDKVVQIARTTQMFQSRMNVLLAQIRALHNIPDNES